jgi:hypothetical protein
MVIVVLMLACNHRANPLHWLKSEQSNTAGKISHE